MIFFIYMMYIIMSHHCKTIDQNFLICLHLDIKKKHKFNACHLWGGRSNNLNVELKINATYNSNITFF